MPYFGSMLGNAGVVGAKWREEGENQYRARAAQLDIQERNRLDALRARDSEASRMQAAPPHMIEFAQAPEMRFVADPVAAASAQSVPMTVPGRGGQGDSVVPPSSYPTMPAWKEGELRPKTNLPAFSPDTVALGNITAAQLQALPPDAQAKFMEVVNRPSEVRLPAGQYSRDSMRQIIASVDARRRAQGLPEPGELNPYLARLDQITPAQWDALPDHLKGVVSERAVRMPFRAYGGQNTGIETYAPIVAAVDANRKANKWSEPTMFSNGIRGPRTPDLSIPTMRFDLMSPKEQQEYAKAAKMSIAQVRSTLAANDANFPQYRPTAINGQTPKTTYDPALVGKVVSFVNTPSGTAHVQRAQTFGVDPVAAMTVFALETSVGNHKNSMQVMDGTWKDMKRWYADPANIKQYNIPPVMVDAAKKAKRGDAESEFDMGLLRMKYSDYIGVPKNLWGAAYQGNADAVKKLNRPINAADKLGTHNATYNSNYVNLYNSVLQAMTPPAQAGAPTATAVATAATPLAAPAAAAGVQPPAATAATSAPAAQPGATPVGVNTAPSFFSQAQAQPVPASRRYTNDDFYFANAGHMTPEVAAAQAQAARYKQYVINAQNEGIGGAAIEQRMAAAQQAEAAMRLAMMEQGVQELSTLGDPRRLAQSWSQMLGTPITIRPRSDGKYDIEAGQGGRTSRIKEGLDKSEVASMARLSMDAAYRQSSSADAMKQRDANLASARKIAEENAKIFGEMTKDVANERIKQQTELTKAMIARKSISVTALGDGTAMVVNNETGGIQFLNPNNTTGFSLGGIPIERGVALQVLQAAYPHTGGQAPSVPNPVLHPGVRYSAAPSTPGATPVGVTPPTQR